MKLKLWHTALRPQYENKIHPTTLQVINQWVKLNPNLEIQRVIADDNFCTSFLEEFDKLYEMQTLTLYNSEEDGRFKSDLFRLCALLQEGGMYVDIDQLPLVEISKFLDLEKIDFCAGVLAPSNYICNGILYAKNPNNKIVRACLDYHIHVYELKAQGKHEGDMSAIHTMCKTIRGMCENEHIQEDEMTIDDYKCLFLQEVEGVNTFLNSFRYKQEPVMMTRYHNYHRDKMLKNEHIPFIVKQDFNVKVVLERSQ